MNKLVSVIVPVYNTEKYLAEALESILSQDCNPLEIIIVDDGSTDNSAEIAQAFVKQRRDCIHYIYQENSGIAATRNRGIELSKGDFLSFLDADDLWSKTKLQHQLAAFAAQPALEIVSGSVQQFFSPDIPPALQQTIHCPKQPMPGHTPGAMLIKRTAFNRLGGFSTQWEVGECIDWYLRIMELKLRFELLPEVLLWRRIHQTNKGIRLRSGTQNYPSILKASLDRRRNCRQQENP